MWQKKNKKKKRHVSAKELHKGLMRSTVSTLLAAIVILIFAAWALCRKHRFLYRGNTGRERMSADRRRTFYFGLSIEREPPAAQQQRHGTTLAYVAEVISVGETESRSFVDGVVTKRFR